MAKYVMVSVYDKKAGCFTAPMMLRSRGEAIRSFQDAMADEKGQFCKHPEDYVLMSVASFDDENGEIEACSSTLITGLDCVRPE